MAKTNSLPLPVKDEGSDCLVEQTLNLIDVENFEMDVEFEDKYAELISWQLIKAADLSSLNDFDSFPVITEEVVLCSIEEVKENCRIELVDLDGTLASITSSDMMIVPVRLGLELVAHSSGDTQGSMALLDSGAHYNYISEDLVLSLQIPVVAKSRKYPVILADKCTKIFVEFETLPISMLMGLHQERISFDVMPTLTYPLIIGLSWLKKHNPVVDWKRRSIIFSRCDCYRAVTPAHVECLDVLSLGSVVASVVRFGEGLEDEEIFDGSEGEVKNMTELPVVYLEFRDVFSAMGADILPEHRKFDCEIELKSPDLVPPFRPIYNLSEVDRIELKKYIGEMLAKGFIRPSKSPAGAGVFFVPKKDKSKRLCVDYRWLNELTVRNSFPLPLISDLIDRLRFAKVFTKVDLRGAYNLVRIKPGDEWKTAFRCVFGHFEYTVMPFGLANAPAIFQSMMNQIFHDILDVFVIIYIDDLLIFSGTESEHVAHVSEVLRRLREHSLYAKLSKCSFHVDSVEFLGFIISGDGISMAEDKVTAIKNWPIPKCVKDIQSFLGFVNFYRKFIRAFASVSVPLVELTKKNVEWVWSVSCLEAFLRLKMAVVSAPSLHHPQFDLPFVLETDASDYAVGAVLSQPVSMSDLTVLNPVGFYSKKLTPPERNYDVHDKELLALICAFSQWSYYLLGSPHMIRAYTDHRNLVYFRNRQTLSPRQLRWQMFLGQFNFSLLYRKGSENIPADLLSRRVDYREGEDGTLELSKSNSQVLLPDKLFGDECISISAIAISGYSVPTFVAKEVDQRKIILQRHGSVLAGHHGRFRTHELIARDFVWPGMRKMIYDYVDSCVVCQQAKIRRSKDVGLLQPLPIPSRPWKDISMDFISGFPESNGYDAILVVVDRFSKMVHLIPCVKTLNAEGLCDLVVHNVVRYHGLPDTVVSDRGPQFVSEFWRTILNLFGVKRSLTSGAHPEGNGQAEKMNQNLLQYLICFVNYLQDDWSSLLSYAEFAINNVVNASTGKSPFEVNYGFNPRMDYLNIEEGVKFESVDSWVGNIKLIQFGVEAALQRSTDEMIKYANRKRIDHKFKVGDLVWLSCENLKLTRPCRKLAFKRMGPFKIIEFVNKVSARLKLPDNVRIHPVFHVSLLVMFKAPMRGQLIKRPMAVEVDADKAPLWEVEAIVRARRRKGILEFLVKWLGYDDLENSWQPLENVVNAWALVRDFYRREPRALKPTRGEVTLFQLEGV